MSFLAFVKGAAQQYNTLSAEKRKEANTEAEAAKKRAAELELYRSKKEIDAEFKTEGKFMTADQVKAFKEANKAEYEKQGYGIFATPKGDGQFEVSFKEIKEAKKPEAKLFPTAESAQTYIEDTSKKWEATFGYRPDAEVKGSGDEFAVTLKTPKKTDKDGAKVGKQFETYEEAEAESKLWKLGPGQAIDITRTEKGFYTLSITTDPAFSKKEGPLVDEMGLPAGLDYYASKTGMFSSDELKKRAGTYSIVPLLNKNLPLGGEAQFTNEFGRDFDIVYTTGIGSDAKAVMADHARKIEGYMTPDRVKSWFAAGNLQGGHAKRASREFITSIKNFVTLYNANPTKLGDNLALRPIEEVYPFLNNYMGIDKELDDAIGKISRPNSMEAQSYVPMNEPAYKKVVNGEQQTLLPINTYAAEAFAKPNQQGKLVYDENFTTTTSKWSNTSGLQQGEMHALINSATDTNGKQSAEAARNTFRRMQDARGVIEGKSDKFVRTDKYGRLVFGVPLLTDEEKMTVGAALNSVGTRIDPETKKEVPNNEAKIKMMRALIPSQSAIDMATSELTNGNSPQGRYAAITGRAEKDFRDLVYQKETADDILGNIETFETLLYQGAEVGAPLKIEQMRAGANYLFNYAKQIAFEDDPDGTKRNAFLADLEQKIGKVSIDDERAARAALTNLMGTMLSYQLARLMDPNGRLSDEDRRTVESAMSFSGLFASRDGALAVLGAMKERADYISARNTALTTGGMQNQIAAQALDVYTEGGNFKKFYRKIFGDYTGQANNQSFNPLLAPPPEPETPANTAPATGARAPIPEGPATTPEPVFDLNSVPNR